MVKKKTTPPKVKKSRDNTSLVGAHLPLGYAATLVKCTGADNVPSDTTQGHLKEALDDYFIKYGIPFVE